MTCRRRGEGRGAVTAAIVRGLLRGAAVKLCGFVCVHIGCAPAGLFLAGWIVADGRSGMAETRGASAPQEEGRGIRRGAYRANPTH